tara:strand:- start:1586 stop:1858 length:273 start_codon:yes stop_codon:yes gene_type:complete
MILYILNQPRLQALEQCMHLMQDQDSLLCLGDAVTLICSTPVRSGMSVYVLSDDLEARALTSHVPSDVQAISYTDFVKMTLDHQQVIRWS